MKGIKGAFKNAKAIKFIPKPNMPCKNQCSRLRKNGSAFCQECSDKHNANS